MGLALQVLARLDFRSTGPHEDAGRLLETTHITHRRGPDWALPRIDSALPDNRWWRSITEERFAEKHWRTALRATNIRPSKFYATRHTFISLTLMAGVVKRKRLAESGGTSIEMIEKHYPKWMDDDRPEELAALGGTAPTRAQRLAVGA